jgi:glycosyltransferase involved in cell wall biosynthesis
VEETMARYFLADPSLLSFSGHCYEYLASLAEPLRREGREVIVLGNRAVDAALRMQRGVIPCFTYWCDTRLETPERTREAHERALCEDLLNISEEFKPGYDDIFVINTLRHWAMRGVVDWLEALPGPNRPKTALILHFTAFPDPNRSDGWEPFYQDAFARIETSECRDRIVLLADSRELVSEYTLLNPGLRIHLAPIPHARIPGNDWDTLARIRAGDRLRIGYVGEARTNKGFDLLPRLLARARELGLLNSMELHIHAFCGNPAAPFYSRTLSGLRDPSVTLYFESMDDREYSGFLAGLDVVALPYTTDNYHSQTSGVFSEAMGGGKVVIVPKGTWLSHELRRHGGGVAFNPCDAEDFSEQALRIVRDPIPYARAAAGRAAIWRRFHNPPRLIEAVTAVTTEPPVAASLHSDW